MTNRAHLEAEKHQRPLPWLLVISHGSSAFDCYHHDVVDRDMDKREIPQAAWRDL